MTWVRVGPAVLAALVVVLTLWLVTPAASGLLDRLSVLMRPGTADTARRGIDDGLPDAVRLLEALPAGARKSALAAAVTPEGHWRLRNAVGEQITAGNSEELARALSTLFPDARLGEGRGPTFLLAADTVFSRKELIDSLGPTARLALVWGDRSYPLIRSGSGSETALFAEIRPRLVLSVGEPASFGETVWQLDRSFEPAALRVLSLEPEGGGPLPVARPAGEDGEPPPPEAVDPYRVGPELRALAGQIAIVTGTVDGELLRFEPASGPARSVILADLFKAAEAADVDLIVLDATSARQPGARNWLWQRTEVGGLDQALRGASLADLLDSLAGGGERLLLSLSAHGELQSRLVAQPAEDRLPPPSGSVVTGPGGESEGGLWTDLVASVAHSIGGDVDGIGIEAALRSRLRQTELDRRLVPYVPADLQRAYLGLFGLGLLGLPTLLRWWRVALPAQPSSVYRSRLAYLGARLVLTALLVLVALPLAGPLALVWSLCRRLGGPVAARRQADAA